MHQHHQEDTIKSQKGVASPWQNCHYQQKTESASVSWGSEASALWVGMENDLTTTGKLSRCSQSYHVTTNPRCAP